MDEELPEEEMGTNVRDRPSIGRMKDEEGARGSRADPKISGTSVVPYTPCIKSGARNTKSQ